MKYDGLDKLEVFDDILGVTSVEEATQKYNLITLKSFYEHFGDLSPEKAEDHIKLKFDKVEYDYGGYTGEYFDNDILEAIKDELYYNVGEAEQIAVITDDLKLVPLDVFLYTPFAKDEKEDFYDADCLDDAYRDAMPSQVYCGAMVEIQDDVDRFHEEYKENVEIDVSGSPSAYTYYTEISKFNENRVSDIVQKAAEQGLSDKITSFLKDCITDLEKERNKSKEKQAGQEVSIC